MKILVNITEKDYDILCEELKGKIAVNKFEKAIVDGKTLPENVMIIDKDKLECDSEWDDYIDGYTCFSPLALEAAEIEIGETNE